MGKGNGQNNVFLDFLKMKILSPSQHLNRHGPDYAKVLGFSSWRTQYFT